MKIIVLFISLIPCISLAAELENPFPPTGLDKIEEKMDKIAESVHQIDKNVAVGKGELSTVADAFSRQAKETASLKDKTIIIEKDLAVVKTETKGNKEEISNIKGNLVKTTLSIITVIGMVIAAYIKSRKTINQKDKS